MTALPTVSYVFPIHNEEGNIAVLYRTMCELFELHRQYEYELIFVNDGSGDRSLALLTEIQSGDDRVVVIDLSRNFGHQVAATAGIEHASGDAVILMDADMQDPPSVSFDLLAEWRAGSKVVYAQRRSRKDSLFKRATASVFYRLLERLSDVAIPRDTGDFRLMDRQVVDELRRFPEHNRFLRGMVSFVGFKQTAVLFDRDERHAGSSSYPLRKMMKFAADGILSFSSAPLKLIGRLGLVIAGLAFAGAVFALGAKLMAPSRVIEGWTFIVISVLFIGGVQLIMLGVLGGYLGRVYTEAQARPLYIVDNVYGPPPRARLAPQRDEVAARTTETSG